MSSSTATICEKNISFVVSAWSARKSISCSAGGNSPWSLSRCSASENFARLMLRFRVSTICAKSWRTPPKRVASEVHPKRSFLDGVSAYYEDDQDVSNGDDAEMGGLPLDDFVYDVYAYDATAAVEPRRVSTSRDHDGAQSLPDDLSRTVDCESLASRAMTPGGDTLSSSGESEDDDGLSTRCVVSPRRRSRAAPLVVGIRHPLRDVLALPRTNEDDPAGTDGDDDVSSLGADDNDRNKSCLLYTSPSPRDRTRSRMPSSA